MKRTRTGVFFRTLSFAGPYRWSVALSVLFAIVFAASSGATIAMILPIFDDVLGGAGDSDGLDIGTAMERTVVPELRRAWSEISEGRPAQAGDALTSVPGKFMDGLHQASPSQALIAVIITMLSLIFVKNLSFFLQTYFVTGVEEGMLRDLRLSVFEHLLALDLGYFSRSRSGELTSRLTADVTLIKGAVTRSLISAIRQLLLLLVYFSLAVWVSWRLILVTLIVLPPSVLLIAMLGKSLRRKSHRAQEKMADFASFLTESISGIRVVKAFAMESFERMRFLESVEGHMKHEMRLRRMQALSVPVTEFLGAVAAAAILWFGGKAVIEGTGMSAGKFMVFLAAALSMLEPAKGLSKAYASIMSGLAAGERVFSILDRKPVITEVTRPVSPSNLEDSIVFEDVTFGYDPDTPVLKNIDLEIRKGEIVALVGPSGGGKSTLADMIPRFYDPDSGRILFDGIDFRELSLSSLRGLLGVVTQETVLFNDSVFNNIAYGCQGIDLERVRLAAGVANALEFIEALPEGFDTVIGERGVTLSGGQRQRLAIARAVLKNPPILIFDEATSALDSRSEKLVQSAIDQLVRGRTSIVIAHRLSTVMTATRVVYIDEGRLLEQGTHQSLMALNGRYRDLWELQFSNG